MIDAILWSVYALAPVAVGGLVHGVPLGLVDTCVLAAVVWLAARRSAIPGGRVAASAAVLTLALAALIPADRGFRARYFADADARGSFERGTDYRGKGYTRIDERLDFDPRRRDLPLWFFNDIARFNRGREGEPDRDKLSFSVYWEGAWWVNDGALRTLFVDAPGASAQLIVDDARVLAVETGQGVVTTNVQPSPGWHRLNVRLSSPYGAPRRFGAGELVGDRRIPFDAANVVTRSLVPWRMTLAAALRAGRTVFDVGSLAWLALLVARDLRKLRRGRRGDGMAMTIRQQALALFAGVAVVEALAFASPWLTRLWILAGGDDPLTYESYAREIQLNGILMRGIDGPYYYQVLYPYFLAATHAVFGENMFGCVFVQRLLGASVAWSVVDIATRLAGSAMWPVALFVGALFSYIKLTPTASAPSTESLFIPLLAAWTAMAVRVATTPTRRGAAATGIVGGLTALTRTTALAAWAAVLPVCWSAWRGIPRRGRLAASMAACAAAIVALIAVRNGIVAHTFAPLPTEFPVTLLGGNEPPRGLALDITRHGALYDRLGLNPLTRQVVEYAITAPADFTLNLGRKILFALGYFEPYAPGWGYSWVLALVWSTAIVGVVIALRAGVAPRGVVMLPLVVSLSQFAVVVIVYPKGERLILPFYTLLVPYSAIALAHAFRLRHAVASLSSAATAIWSRVGTWRTRAVGAVLVLGVAIYTFVIRTRGISDHFLMLGEQIRDWSFALGPFSRLPLVGTPSTAGGNTLGPIFYWVLWLIRVVFGPLADNLPHAGGIGLSAAQSLADAIVCVGIRRASGSWIFAVAAVLILASSPFDLALSAVIWNPVLAVVFAKIAIGLVLFWGEHLTRTRRLVLCVSAWLAVQAHSGALPFASAIFLYVLLLEWRAGARTAIVALVEIGLIVVALQIPSTFARQSVQPNKLLALLLHPEQVRPLDAFRALGAAIASIAAAPFDFPVVSLVLLASAATLLVIKRLLSPIVAVTVVPLGFAVLFWSLWQGDAYEAYAFLTLVPPAGLLTLWALRMLPDRAARSIAAVLLLVVAVAIQKPRIANAALVFRQPSYGALIRGTRALIAQGQTVRRVEAPFLPLTSDPEFVYTILGGKLSPDSTVVATLSENGEVSYAR